MKLVPLYAGVLALIFFVLCVRIIVLRNKLKIGVGDGGDRQLLRASRVQANFAEYVPLCLLLLYFGEAGGASRVLLHALLLCLVVGRVLHAWGVSQSKERLIFRQVGMVLTFTVLTCSAVLLIFQGLR